MPPKSPDIDEIRLNAEKRRTETTRYPTVYSELIDNLEKAQSAYAVLASIQDEWAAGLATAKWEAESAAEGVKRAQRALNAFTGSKA